MKTPVLILCLTLVVAATLLVGLLPGIIAKSRRHTAADAIMLCGFLGLGTGIFWLVALVWAHTQDNRPREMMRCMPFVAGRLPTVCGLCGEVLRLNPGERTHCPKCGALVQAA